MHFRSRAALLSIAALLATVLVAGLAPTGALAGPTGPRDGIEIVGGSPAAQGEFPYQVGLLFRNESDGYYAQFCGGSIISPTAVLTAAHCVEDIAPSGLDILVGTVQLRSGGQRIPATQIHIHPQWNTNTFANDAAIVEVATPLTETPVLVVQPGHDSLFSAGTNVTITGWGDTTGNENYTTRLHKVTLPTTSDSTCRSVYGAGNFLSSTMFCAGRPQGGKDSCQGDSGGPVAVRAGSNWVQVGIVSWGVGCALPGIPGVNSRISRLSSFIGPYLEPRAHPFYDIAPWLEEAAVWTNANGVMDGFGDGTFGPAANLTRAQAIRLLWRLRGEPAEASPHGFSDVPPWVDAAVRWAAHDPDDDGPLLPVVEGYDSGTFKPNASITRGAWSRMLHRIEGSVPASQVHTFGDVPPWADEAVSWITDPVNVPPYAEGFAANNTFRPLTSINRGQAVRMAFRIYGGP